MEFKGTKDMSTIKYTTDGRKVVVIGDLNQTEKIVQEIFVTKDGDEIPSGERFVVKSLLDAPAKSWKEQELIKLEARFEKERKEWEDRIKNVKAEKELVYKSLYVRVKWLKQVAKQPHPEALRKVIETLALFLSNSDMWVFYADYSTWYLEKYDQEGFSRIHDSVDSGYRISTIDKMKLVSLFGNTEGNFQFRINEYSDGSGSSKDIEYFKSKDDALVYIQNRFDSIQSYDDKHLKIAEKFNLKINKTKLSVFRSNKKQSILKNIEKTKEALLNYEKSLDDFEALGKEADDE